MTPPSPPARHGTGTGKLLADVTGAVAVVTINNPAKRNALSAEIRAALPGLMEALQADGDVRAVILTGAGDKAFASGADISEFGERRTSPTARAEYDRDQEAIYDALAGLDKPVIAMIRGYCLGQGLLTAVRADIRIAADDSQFGIPAARLGLGPRFSSVAALVDLVGPAWASEILFSARRFSAAEALQMGLVNRVVPAADLRDEVMRLAQGITRNAPLTVAAAKAAIRAAGQPPDRRDLARVEAMSEACFRSGDYLEGQRAFAEKRPPAFTGN
jgi:enoyl-CoA hydratase/carnithine racemase